MACAGCAQRRANIGKLVKEVIAMATKRRSPKEEKDLLALKREAIDLRLKKEEARDKEREVRAKIKRMGSR